HLLRDIHGCLRDGGCHGDDDICTFINGILNQLVRSRHIHRRIAEDDPDIFSIHITVSVEDIQRTLLRKLEWRQRTKPDDSNCWNIVLSRYGYQGKNQSNEGKNNE